MSTSLFETLTSIGLLSADEIESALAAVPESEMPLTEDAFRQRLVRVGKLTEFQATALADGRVGDVVFGNYVVLDRLGSGGMGTVFKARHRRMKRLVAIKLLLQASASSPGLVERFQREVEAIAQLTHPNIVAAFDADEGPTGPFLVMEYVEGSDLAELVRMGGPLSVHAAVDAIMQAARGLDFAHSQGVVHRDIKPGNLMRDTRGTIKVTDLGLARVNAAMSARAAVSSDMTQDGSVFGTVDFISPEQALNTKNADRRSDVYSLGCTLYYLLTGQHVYGGETIMEKILAHREQSPPSVRDVRPDVPESVAAVFQKMLAKRPAERLQSMADVIRDLEACAVPPSAELHWKRHRAPATQPGAADLPTTAAVGAGPTLVELAVLLVEPSRTQALVTNRQLQGIGIRRVQSCADGASAIKALHRARIDLVISAMHLSDMTGAELVKRMRADSELAHTGFVLVSSETDQKLIEPIRQMGAVAILPKPFGLDQLKRALLAGVDFLSPGPAPPGVNAELLKVLIVDDSGPARYHVRRALENMGVRDIVQAANGREAALLLAGGRFDLVVTDYNMPEMDGRELLCYIRGHSAQPDLPVLMVTTETDEGRLAAVRQAGVSALCDKVFDPKNIRAILEKILAKR